MNEYESHEPSSRGTIAALVWLGVVALFLAWLGWIVFSVAPAGVRNIAAVPPIGSENDPGAVFEGLRIKGSAVELPAFDAADPSNAYVLAGAGLQGLHQQTAPGSVWTSSDSSPELAVQLVKRGPPIPQILTENVTVTWELEETATLKDPAAPRSGTMEAVEGSHFRTVLPLSAFHADGMPDPYPVVTLEAKDATTGETLVQSAAVLAVSPGFGCGHCHENAGTAILEVHDRHQGTTLLARNAKGETIACRSCHADTPAPRPAAAPDGQTTATDAAAGKTPKQNASPLNLSAAIHGWHAAYLPDRGADACMSCHISLGRVGNDPQSAPKMMFARDMLIERTPSCVSCHGVMENHAQALLKAEQLAGKAQAAKSLAAIAPGKIPLADIVARQPWVQEPDCTSCHDFTVKPDPATASGFNAWTDTAEGEETLFGKRKDDMMTVRCITCHGAPHATYRAENPLDKDLDNMPPMQYQKLAAPWARRATALSATGNRRIFRRIIR